MIQNYDIDQLKDLMDSFYSLLKIRIVVFDDRFEKIAEVPDRDCRFCSILLGDQEAAKECRKADYQAFLRCRETHSAYSYICHAGLTETVVPIQHGNITIGYLMFGQVLLPSDAGAYWEEVQARCAKYDIDMGELCSAYREKEQITHEQVGAASKLLEACASYIWLKRHISQKEDGLLFKIDAYITDNLDKDLSAGTLCKKFGISRSTLYRVTKKYYASGIYGLIRQLRVNRAKELLQNTDLSVNEVALRSGYTDYNYFIKVFKSMTDFTPVRYKKGL